jgi:transcriptional regulator with XRE-family HTH domain
MTSPPAYALWLRLQEEMVRRGWNQDELSKRIGLSRQTLAAFRTNGRPPQARLIKQIADGLGIDEVEVARLAGVLPPAPSHDVDVREAIRRSAAFTERQRTMLLDLVDELERANNRTGDSAAPDSDTRQAI